MAKCLHILVLLAALGNYPLVFCQMITPDGQTQSLEPVTNLAAGIYGSINDGQTGEPMVYATVILYRQELAIQGCITDETGKYRLEQIPQGSYELHIRYLGYREKTIPIDIGESIANKGVQVDVRLEQHHPCICLPAEIEPTVNDKTVQTYQGWLAEHIILQNGVF
jgi:hypothetical protein